MQGQQILQLRRKKNRKQKCLQVAIKAEVRTYMLLVKIYAAFRDLQGDAHFYTDIQSLSLVSDLHPVDKLGHITAHKLGVGSRGWVMLLCTEKPVHDNDIGRWLTFIQSCHQFGNPTLIHTSDLNKDKVISVWETPSYSLCFKALNELMHLPSNHE